MKAFVSVIMAIGIALFSAPGMLNHQEFQESDSLEVEEVYENYIIYDEQGNYLTERRGVALGDIIIDKDFNKYEIVFLDDEKLSATAKFIQKLEKPRIHKKQFENVSKVEIDKKIGLYSTHNDESYILGDGTESVYGVGGIHDIGNLLAQNLRSKNLNVEYNETLHIPHNSSAYTRSRNTAKKLLEDGATAIFDIHRDGASRNFYLASHDGKKYSKVRIVVGQSNPNQEDNLQFALWIVDVAQSMHPWLIADIYYGSGKYNQDLSSKALLFEMGCHQIEKEYVENTVPVLSDVICTTLFGTTVEEESGDLTIGDISSSDTSNTIDEVLEQKNHDNNQNNILFWVVGITAALILTYLIVRKIKRVKINRF